VNLETQNAQIVLLAPIKISERILLRKRPFPMVLREVRNRVEGTRQGTVGTVDCFLGHAFPNISLIPPIPTPSIRAGTSTAQSSNEVSFREGSPGSRLQIPLEKDRAVLIRELDRRDQFPGPMVDRVERPTRIVRVEAPCYVGGKADVVARGISGASENVNEALAV
jgi:hypothetical protein